MSSRHPMDRHHPRRNDAIGFVRRMVRAGTFTKADVSRWKKQLGDEVDDIVQELAPKKTRPRKTGPTTASPESQEE